MTALLHPDTASPPPASVSAGSATVCVKHQAFLSVPHFRPRKACVHFTALCPNLWSSAKPLLTKLLSISRLCSPHRHCRNSQLNPKEAAPPCSASVCFTLSRTSTVLASFGVFFFSLHSSPGLERNLFPAVQKKKEKKEQNNTQCSQISVER